MFHVEQTSFPSENMIKNKRIKKSNRSSLNRMFYVEQNYIVLGNFNRKTKDLK